MIHVPFNVLLDVPFDVPFDFEPRCSSCSLVSFISISSIVGDLNVSIDSIDTLLTNAVEEAIRNEASEKMSAFIPLHSSSVL